METRHAAGIILYKDGKILLQHRTADAKSSPNKWGIFGGGIEGGETPLEAVKREAYEELEYRLKDPRFIEVGEKEENGMYFRTHLFVEEYDGSPLVLHEGQAYGWFTIDEAFKLPMSDSRRESLERIQDKIF